MKKHAILSALILVIGLGGQLARSGETEPGLVHHPEGDAIVLKNGSRWDNRPMYCFERMAIVNRGEMPGLSGKMGVLRVAIQRGTTRLALHQFSKRVMRYHPGRLEWEMTDPQLSQHPQEAAQSLLSGGSRPGF